MLKIEETGQNMTKYALKTLEMCRFMYLYQNYAKYAQTSWAHFPRNFMNCKHLTDMRYYLSHIQTWHFIKIRALRDNRHSCTSMPSVWLTNAEISDFIWFTLNETNAEWDRGIIVEVYDIYTYVLVLKGADTWAIRNTYRNICHGPAEQDATYNQSAYWSANIRQDPNLVGFFDEHKKLCSTHKTYFYNVYTSSNSKDGEHITVRAVINNIRGVPLGYW